MYLCISCGSSGGNKAEIRRQLKSRDINSLSHEMLLSNKCGNDSDTRLRNRQLGAGRTGLQAKGTSFGE